MARLAVLEVSKLRLVTAPLGESKQSFFKREFGFIWPVKHLIVKVAMAATAKRS
jgi:hypothetical protein